MTWLYVLTLVGSGASPVFWVLLRRARSPRALPLRAPALPRYDWCGGCDEIRPPSYMAFTEAGTYRCALCRSEPEPVSPQQPSSQEIPTLQQSMLNLVQYGVVSPQDASLRATELSPQVIAGLRAHLKFSPQDRADLIEKWGSSWLPEETRCWDCDQVFDGPVGRCPVCTDKWKVRGLVDEAGILRQARPPAGTRTTGALPRSGGFTINSNNKTVTIHDL